MLSQRQQTVHVTFPAGIGPEQLPSPLEAHTLLFWFRQAWEQHDGQLVVPAELTSSVPGRACSPEDVNAVTDAFQAVKERHHSGIVGGFARAQRCSPVRGQYEA